MSTSRILLATNPGNGSTAVSLKSHPALRTNGYVWSKTFEEMWQFPNCIGALGGKHIAIKAPSGEGLSYYNYKHFHSIILLALVDANLKFLYVDVGANGRSGDAGVFRDSPLFQGLERKSLNVPRDKPLPGMDQPTPHVIVGDDAFPLKTYLMKPYPDKGDVGLKEKMQSRIFNYRLSRARRYSKNAFVTLCQRFGIFQSAINLTPDKAILVTQTAICLHNFLITERNRSYNNRTQELTMQQDSLTSLAYHKANRSADNARQIRDLFKQYVNGPGAVPWQKNHI
ncbi:hypothetical protein RRG08_057671 [Elysia crispata]|uniref:DDE Tnp4 domain-containing protein n=1 Tax=Elysia crispata TaxID=231223 RepID=A0AAE0XYS6_9GAST|nr:hypothetical protein RRG08_057671 [Elysia crispata]